MAFELEALVGHLYIVGGRLINTTPPGALVEVAPGKAARGREIDTFFALVLPSGDIAPTSFYEQMALMSAERYFRQTGSVTAAVRSVLNNLNYNLYEHNQSGRHQYEASMICAVMRGTELTVGRVGAAIAVLRHSGQTHTYPEDLTDDETLYRPPLGIQPVPDIRLKRYTIDAGSRLLLGDPSLAELAAEPLTQALVAGSIEQTVKDVRALLTLQAQVIVAEFVASGDAPPVPAMTGESSNRIAVDVAAARAEARSGTDLSDVLKERRRRKPSRLMRGIRSGISGLVHHTGGSLTTVADLAGKVFKEPEDDDQKKRASRFATGAMIGLPSVLILLVVFLWLGDIPVSEFEECFGDAQAAAELARSIPSDQRQSVLAAWQGTLEIADACEALRPDDPNISAIRTESQTVIDTLNNIVRRGADTLTSLPNASITTLVIQGLDIYALDGANDLVYRVQIGGDGRSAISAAQPIVNMRRGASVGSFQVGDIIDITFDDQRNTIVMVDRDGLMVRCPPRFIMQCEAEQLLGAENWTDPRKITFWQGRLYLLDPAGGQLWRYEPSGSNFISGPTEYFTGQVRPNLGAAVDFDISSRGTVFVLYSDGVMTSYFGGEPQSFAFSGFPQGQELSSTTVQGFFLNDSPITPGFYIVSQATRTIYETTLAGTFVNSYRVFDESMLALLSDVVADPGQEMIYVASGNSIVALSRQD